MRTAFHITKRKNLYSILQDGLKINSGISGICSKVQCSRYDEYYGCQPIFVTTDISACARRYLTNEFIEMEDCVCLEVDIFDFKVEYEYQYVRRDKSVVSWNFKRNYSNISPRNRTKQRI